MIIRMCKHVFMFRLFGLLLVGLVLSGIAGSGVHANDKITLGKCFFNDSSQSNLTWNIEQKFGSLYFEFFSQGERLIIEQGRYNQKKTHMGSFSANSNRYNQVIKTDDYEFEIGTRLAKNNELEIAVTKVTPDGKKIGPMKQYSWPCPSLARKLRDRYESTSVQMASSSSKNTNSLKRDQSASKNSIRVTVKPYLKKIVANTQIRWCRNAVEGLTSLVWRDVNAIGSQNAVRTAKSKGIDCPNIASKTLYNNESICALSFGIPGYKVLKKAAVQEAKRRGLTCGVGETSTTQIASSTTTQSNTPTSAELLAARRKAEELEQQVATVFNWQSVAHSSNANNEAAKLYFQAGELAIREKSNDGIYSSLTALERLSDTEYGQTLYNSLLSRAEAYQKQELNTGA